MEEHSTRWSVDPLCLGPTFPLRHHRPPPAWTDFITLLQQVLQPPQWVSQAANHWTCRLRLGPRPPPLYQELPILLCRQVLELFQSSFINGLSVNFLLFYFASMVGTGELHPGPFPQPFLVAIIDFSYHERIKGHWQTKKRGRERQSKASSIM